MSYPNTLLAALLVLVSLPLPAAEVEISETDSVFAILTHKGGFAASRAHDHLIAATGYEIRLELDPQAPLAAAFEIDLPVTELEVDPPGPRRELGPRLIELGLYDEPFGEISEGDRAKVRQAMLDDGQLAAAEFPRIEARLVAVENAASTLGGVTFPYSVTLALTVRGETVEKPVAARYEVAGDELTVEAVGSFHFTDFGIEPYSAFFGAVKNLDRFQVYVRLRGSL